LALFHGLIIEYFDGILIRTKYTPFLFDLIIRT